MKKRVQMEQAYYPKHMHPMLKILRHLTGIK